MKPLTSQNVESELSYAYLHAVASHAGVGCKWGSRHDDNTGVDALLTSWGPFPAGGYRDEIDIKVQLKATVVPPVERDGVLSYGLKGIPQYDDLRSNALATPRILVVLFLPAEHHEWMSHTDDGLSLHRCAYWVSLRQAPPSQNETSQTVYLPKTQRFDVQGLRKLFDEIALGNVPAYRGREA